MKLKKPRKDEVRILIVDDETIVALDIKNTLQKYGYTVIGVASNAKEAIEMVKTSSPNMILMDIMLKGNKDGIEVSSEINKFADIPIIFLTAYSDDHTLERAKKVEPYGYLIKPFDNRELFTTIEMSLYKHSMELSVRESEESLSITLNSIGDAVISTDENGLVVRMNPVAEKLTGWKFEEAKGKILGEIFFLISADTREPMNNPVDKVIQSGEVIGLSNHTILIARDGTERNISDSAAPIRDSEGNIKGVVLVFSDVTEAYKAREEISASEEKFRQLVTQMEQGLAVHEVIYNKKGRVINYRFLELNSSYEKLTGLKKENIIGKTVKEVLPNVEEYWIEKFGEVAISGIPLEYENFVKELNKYYHVIAYRNRPDQFAVIVSDITDRKMAEKELSIKDQAIASSINAIALADLNGNLTYVNNSFLGLWGYKTENEVLGRSALEFWQNKNDAKKVIEYVRDKGSFIGELKAERKDGKLLDLFLTSTMVYGIDGKPVQIMASFIDVTERKTAEEKIHLMADLLDLSPASVIVHDMQGNIVYVNKRSLELHGYTEKQFLKLNLRDLDTPESAELIEQRIAEINRTGELTFEVSHRKKDGQSFPLLVHTRKTQWGGKDVLLSISNDITEQKKQEEILREKTEELDNYFTNSLDLFCIANTDGHFLRLNKQWENLLGYELNELERNRFLDFIHPDDMESTLNSISKLSSQQEVIGFTNRYRAKDGSYKFIEWHAYPAGNRIYAAARDITERKKAEDALRESEEMFRSYVESAPEAIMVVDEKGNYVLVNRAACEMTGYSNDELLKMHIMDVTYQGDFEKGKTHFKNVVEKGEATDEVRFVTKNGEIRYWSVKAVKLSENRFLGFQSDITERKLAAIALKESEERFALVIDASEQGIWDWNIPVNKVYFSPQWKKQIGYEDNELENDFNIWVDHLHPEDKEMCLSAVQTYLNNPQKHFILEFRFRHKDGGYRWIHNKAASILDEEGKVVRMFGSHTDITKRKLAEEALKESEERYKTFIESTDDMAFVKDESLRYIVTNNVLANLFGKQPAEVVGKTDNNLMPPEGAANCMNSDLRAIHENRLIISEETIGDRVYETRKFPVHFKNGSVGVGGYIRDITEKTLAEKTLKESEEKYRTLMENLNEAVMLVDNEDRILFVNEKFEKLFGYTVNEVIGKIGYEFLLDKKDKHKIIDAMQQRKERKSSQYEACFLTKNGEQIIFLVNGSPVFDSNGNVIGSLGAMTDITERKKADEELERTKIQLKETIMQSPLPMVLASAEDFKLKVINKATEDFLLINADDYLEKSVMEIDLVWQEYTPEGLKVEPHELPLPRALQGMVTHSQEMRLERSDGSSVWQLASGAPIFDSQGKLIAGLLVMQDITDRKRAEETLKESEDRFSRAIAGTGAGLWDWDIINNKVYFSPQWKSMLGYKDNEVENDFSGWKNLWHPEDAVMIENAVNDYIQMKTAIYEVVHRLRHKDGSWHWILTRGDIHRDAAGNPIRWVGTNIDITERKKIQDALVETERKFKTLFETMPNGYYRSTPEGYFVDANPSFIKMLGYESFEELKKIYIPRDLFVQSSEREEILTGNPDFVSDIETYRLKTKDGRVIWIEDNARYIKDNNGKVIFNEGICKDITDRKNAEDALRESEQLFTTLAQVSPVGIFRTDPDGYTTYVNPTWTRLAGIAAEKAMGDGWLDAVHPEDREKLRRGWVDDSRKQDVSVAEYRFLRPDGNIVWVMGQAIPEFSPDNKLVGYVGTITDITERKLAEEALKESEEKFRSITEQTNSLISLTDNNGIITYASPASVSLFNCKPEEMLGCNFAEFLDQSSIPLAEEAFRKALSNQQDTKNLELKMKRSDGTFFFGELNGSRFEWGDQRGTLVVINDISEKKESEKALMESEERLRILAEKTGTIVYDRNMIDNTVHREGAINEVLGYSKEEFNSFSAQQFNNLLHEKDREFYDRIKKEIISSGGSYTINYRLKHKNGSYIYIEDNGIALKDDNKIIRILGSMKDVTEKKIAENTLKESEERLRILAEKTGTIVYDRDLKTNIVHRTGAIEEVLGYSKEDYNKFTIDQFNELLHEEDRTDMIIGENRVIKTGGNLTQFYRMRHKNGNYIQIEDNCIVLTEENGAGVRMLGSMKDITERRLTELALKESEELHRKLLMTVPDLIIRTNLNGDIIFVNESTLQSLGYVPKERLLGKNILTFISEKDKERAIHNTRLMFEKPLGIQEYTLVFEDGIEIISEVNGDIIIDADSNPIGMVYVVRDITERKKDEENLRKLSHAVEQSQVSIVITNRTGEIEYVNPKFCQVTGYTYEEAIGQNPRILKSGEWKSETYSGMWTDLSSGRNWTGIFHNRKKNGELFWESAHISPIKDPNGEITHYIAVKEDITEKVKAEEELIRYREHLEEMVEERTSQINSQNVFLRTLIDTIPNPIFVKDSNGYYTDVNPAFEKFYGMKKEELIGKKLDVVLSGEAKRIALETDEKLKKEQGIVSYEVFFEKGDGSKVPVIVYKSSFGISSNEPEGIMGMFIDISERKEMEEKTIQALNRERELNEMKTNFISMASHEFRTPLTTILASADLVEMYHSKWSAEKILNHITKIQDSVNYMTTLLDDVLTLSRADRGKLKFSPAKANVKEICKQIIDEINYQALPGHNLIFNYNLKTEFANIDNKLLHQILNNLLSNAVKFSPEGGNILLEVSESGNKILFTVKDEGLGIDGSDIKNIFEPFFRGKNVTEIHGSGLGLNIVKNAVELHGGEISMESELNKGSKFTFTIKPND